VKQLDDESGLFFKMDLLHFIKILAYICSLGVVLFALFLMLALFKVSSFSFHTYDSYQKIPHNKVGLLLGTSPNVSPGQDNQFFTFRIMAVSELFKAKKIDYILVSGDNRHISYNEPRMMFRALVKAGVPADRIVMDFAGFSTLDSVIRASKVFMLSDVTIISQSFHNERALFMASKYGLNAIGYNAKEPTSGWGVFKVKIRELFARIKCVLDVYFLDTQPHFLGEPIAIANNPLPKKPSNKPKWPTSKPKVPGSSVSGLNKDRELEKIRAIAKKPSDSARELKANAEMLRLMQEENAHLQEAISPVASELQGELLNDAQQKAIEDASELAADSLNSGEATYIDPSIQTEDALENTAAEDVQQ